MIIKQKETFDHPQRLNEQDGHGSGAMPRQKEKVIEQGLDLKVRLHQEKVPNTS